MIKPIIIAFLFFFIMVLSNCIFLRKKKILSEINHYLLFFVGLPLLFFLISYLASIFNKNFFLTSEEILYSCILNICLSSAFIMTIPGLNNTPPTLAIMSLFFKEKKITKQDALDLFANSNLLKNRRQLLFEDNLIEKKGQKLSLTFFGAIIAKVFICYKKLIGEDIGLG